MKSSTHLILVLTLIHECGSCSDFGTLHLLDEFYQWKLEPDLIMKWDQKDIDEYSRKIAIIKKVSTIAQFAINALVPRAHSDLTARDAAEGVNISIHDRPPLTVLQDNSDFIKMSSENYSHAYDKCAKLDGHLPIITSVQDENDLLTIARKYKLRKILVSANLGPDLSGPTSYSGFLMGTWDTQDIQRPEKENREASGFRNVLRYKFKNVDNPAPAARDGEETVWQKTSGTEGAFICILPKSQWKLSRDGIDSFKWQLEDLVKLTTSFYAKLKANEHMFNISSTEVQDIKSRQIIKGGRIILGIEGYIPLLYSFSMTNFYQRVKVDHIGNLVSLTTMLRNLLNPDHDHDVDDFLSMQSSQELIGHLVGTGNLEILPKMNDGWLDNLSSLLRIVKVKLKRSYEGGIWRVAVKRISKSSKNKIYRIRKFITSKGQQISDNFVVDAGSESYSAHSLPSFKECATIGENLACLGPFLDSSHTTKDSPTIQNIECGKSVIKYSNSDSCKMETVTVARPYIINHAKCTKDNVVGDKHNFFDVLNSNFAGKIERKCDGKISVIPFEIGHTKLNTSYEQNCDYIYDGIKIHGSSPGDKYVGNDDYMHSTILGKMNISEIRSILIITLSLIATLTVAIVLGCCPRCRDAVAYGLCCCCQDNGWPKWKQMVKDAGLNCKRCVKGKTPEAVPLNELGVTSRLDPQSVVQPIMRREPERLSRNANQGSNRQILYPARRIQFEVYPDPDYPERFYDGRKGNY